jgi:CubicO group peptidase (beta-lactamase class C family)
MGVLKLEATGYLDIDFPLDVLLSDFSIRSRFGTTVQPITLRNMLTHHAGLPTDLSKGMWTDEPYTAVVAALKEEYAAFPPNLVYSYSNLGYTLLGHMLESVSEVAFAKYIATHIFRPLGMQRSSMGVSQQTQVALSKGYRNGWEEALLPMRDIPAMGLYTSAADLGRLMRMILNGGSFGRRQILPAELLSKMMQPQNLDVALDMNVINGLGWFLEENTIPNGGQVVRHGGTTLLFSSELIMLPDKGLGVAVLSNSSDSRFIVSQLARAILVRTLQGEQELRDAQPFVAKLSRYGLHSDPVEISGNYATDVGLLSIRAKDEKVCACMVEKTFDLIPYPNGWFGIGEEGGAGLSAALEPLARMQFQTRRIDGKEVMLAKNEGRLIVLGEKIPPTPVPHVWLQRMGDYEVLNPDAGFPIEEPRLNLNNGHLCMSYRMPKLSSSTIQVPLIPISDTEAVVLGLGRTRGDTLRAFSVDGEERLRYSGYIGRRRNTNPL